jgi:hypothetical protein
LRTITRWVRLQLQFRLDDGPKQPEAYLAVIAHELMSEITKGTCPWLEVSDTQVASVRTPSMVPVLFMPAVMAAEQVGAGREETRGL